jgi:hypothetical protein
MDGFRMAFNKDEDWSCSKDPTRKIDSMTFPCKDFKRRQNRTASNNPPPPQLSNASTDETEDCGICEYSILNVG